MCGDGRVAVVGVGELEGAEGGDAGGAEVFGELCVSGRGAERVVRNEAATQGQVRWVWGDKPSI